MPSLPRSSRPQCTKPQRSSGLIRSTHAISSLRPRRLVTCDVHIALENDGQMKWTLACSKKSSRKLLDTVGVVLACISSANRSYILRSWTPFNTSSKPIMDIQFCSPQMGQSSKLNWTPLSNRIPIKFYGHGDQKLNLAKQLKIGSGSGESLGSASSRKSRRRKPGRSGSHGQT